MGHRGHDQLARVVGPGAEGFRDHLELDRDPGASSYTLATILNTTPTRNTTYQTVTGTTFTPPAVPGQTVNYGLAPNIAGGRWATEVSINWPASAGALRVGLNETTGWGADPLSRKRD